MKKLSKFEITAGILGPFLLLFFVLFYVFIFSLFMPSKTVNMEIERELANIKARGEPISLSELASPPIPDEENAAFIYKKVFEKIGEIPKDIQDLLSKRASETTSEEEMALKSFLDEKGEVLSLLNKALSYEKCQFPINYKEGYIPELEHLNGIRNCARLLALQSLWETSEGNADNAINNSLEIIELSESISTESFIISQLVNIAIGNLMINSLEEILLEDNVSAESLQKVITILDNYEKDLRQGFKLGLVGERCIFIGAFENPGNFFLEGIESDINRKKVKAILKSSFFKNDQLYGIRMYTNLINLCEFPLHQALKESKVLKEDAEDSLDFKPWKFKNFNILSKMMLPAMDRMFLQWARHNAKLQQARIAAALELYRMKYGVYPEYILDIPPEILYPLPKDPFTGEDYVYRREKDNFILYSVGENLKDDDGISCIKNEKNKKENADIVWGKDICCK